MYVFVRHAERVHGNKFTGDLPFDSLITKCGIEKSKVAFEKLFAEYGTPSGIITSPYRRTRKTAAIASEVCGISITCVDPRIGEYVGFHQKDKFFSGITKTTKNLGAKWMPIDEFRLGLLDFLKQYRDPGWYLIITHSHTIHTIGAIHGMFVKHPSNLNGIIVDNMQIKELNLM